MREFGCYARGDEDAKRKIREFIFWSWGVKPRRSLTMRNMRFAAVTVRPRFRTGYFSRPFPGEPRPEHGCGTRAPERGVIKIYRSRI